MVTTMEHIGKLLLVISQIKTPSFVRILNYRNDKGEISNYTLNLGINYGNAKESDTDFLRDPKNLESIDFGKLQMFAEQARREMLESRTMETNIRSQAQSDAYQTICPNIRVHKETGKIFIFGFIVTKEILIPGEYKTVNSRPLTLAKKKIEKVLKCSNFRELSFNRLDTVRAKGQELIIDLTA